MTREVDQSHPGSGSGSGSGSGGKPDLVHSVQVGWDSVRPRPRSRPRSRRRG